MPIVYRRKFKKNRCVDKCCGWKNMMSIYKPKGEEREWKSVSMSLRLDAEINYLLEKEIWSHGGTKQKIVNRILDAAIRNPKLLRQILSNIEMTEI